MMYKNEMLAMTAVMSLQQGGSFFIKSRSMLPAQADKNKGEDTEVSSPPDYSSRQCNSLI